MSEQTEGTEMKILIEESVLRQWNEVLTHCYAETERRINDRARVLKEMQSHLDAAETVEPVFWYCPLESGCYEGPKHNSQMEKVRKTSGVWVPLYPHPAPAVPEGWLRAIDDAMVVCHLGIAEATDSYETAKQKLHELIQWHIQVATDPCLKDNPHEQR